MKKQGAGKKGLTGILIAAGALVLIAAVVLGIMLLGGKPETPASEPNGQILLYWNVERDQYVGKGVDGASGRMARSDGYYYVRFAVGGEQIDYQVADYNLIQKIDQLDVMGLEFDEQGVVIGVKNINECTGGAVATALYVSKIDANTLHCNTQGTYKGIDVTLELPEDVQIYDVGQTGLLCGVASAVEIDDEILAIRDYDGKIIYVYKRGYEEPGDVYWNITRMYNSASKTSTRQLDPTGGYVFDMALNGEVVQVRTRDYDIATKIDAKAAKCTGLEFDENGNVIAVTSASNVAGGTTFASWAHVFEVKDGEIYAKKLSGSAEGTEYYGTISKNCKIINVSGVGGEMGSYTELQYGDQIHGLTDIRGRVCYVWVISRLAGNDGWQLFWNVERKYDSTNVVTKRTPAADGYYYIDVATGGQQITVKTKDKDMATKLDSYAARCFTMKLGADNEIEMIGSATQIHGGSTFGSWYYVDKIDGKNLTVSRVLTGDTEPTIMQGIMSDEVEIINGSTNFTSHCGEYAQLKVGDRVHCLKDLYGNIRVIFIVEKSVPGPLYWNVTKMAVKNDMTTRQRAADGYFYFTMAGGGKQYEFKTKDAEIATKIDNTAAKCMGLTVTKNGIITKVHGAGAVEGCQGGTKSLSWVDVTSLSGRSIVAQKNQAGHAQDGQIFTTKMASGCKVYNVSSNVNSFCGEETTLRVGDRIHVLHNRSGDATVIFVVSREKTLDEKNTCPCNANATWEPWDGTTALENNKYYYLTADVKAPTEGFVLEGIFVSLRLDGHTISSDGRCFYVKSGGKLNICDHDTRGKLIGSGVVDAEGNPESGGVIRVYSASGTVNLWNIDIQRKDTGVMAKEGGLISCSGTVSVYNCNLSGGAATVKGGNVQVSPTGTFRMFGGTVKGGTAPSASSINVTGRTYLEDVSITGGSGNTVMFNTDKDMVINGVTIDKAYANSGTVTLLGTVSIDSLTVTQKAVLADGGMEPGGKITLTCKPETSQVVMTGASQVGYKAMTSFDPVDYVLSYDADKKEVTVTCTIEPKTHTNNHCACAGNASGLGEHTCTDLTGWKVLTADILVDSPTAGNLAFPESGNYYLSLDLSLSKSIDILPDQQITLCLNGCELTGSKRIFRINGTLNITDCSGEGQIVGKAALAPVFYTYAGGTFNLFGGTLSSGYSGTVSYWGGVGAIASDAGNAAAKGSSTMNMYGGTIVGGKTFVDANNENGVGGAIAMFASGGNVNAFYMYGGTITGGTAEKMGGNLHAPAGSKVKLLGGTITAGDVYLAGDQKQLVGGSVKIEKLHLAAGTVLELQDLKSDASVGIEMAKPGVFAENVSAYTGGFTSVDDTYEVAYSGGKLKLDLNASLEGHIHCVCGGTADGMHTHECAKQVYKAWESKDSLPSESGNYYLTEDVHLTSTEGHKIDTNTINLCLNGHKITGEGRLFWVNSGSGTLNICDHAGNSGSLEAPGVADSNAGGLIRHGTGNGHVGLYNITMRRTDPEDSRVLVKEGGIMSCSAYLDMYNVTMENGYAKKAGNLLIALTAKVNIVGCTFRDGNATNDAGGNIYIGGNNASNPVAVTIIDSTVTGGSSTGSGDGIYLGESNAYMTLGGKITITENDGQDLYIGRSGTLSLEALSDESKIGVTMKTTGVIAEAEADLSDCFTSNQSGLNVYYDENAHEIYLADRERSNHQDHCICGGEADSVGGHSCDADVQWQILTAADFEDTNGTSTSKQGIKLISDGYYYLTENMELSARLCILPGQNVHICLNGYTLSRTGGSAIYVAGNLSVTDCGEAGCITSSYSTTNTISNGGTVKLLAGSKLELYGGTLTGEITGMVNGGVIQLSVDKGNLTTSTEDAVFNMYGGTITGGNATNGGNLCAWKNTAFNMYGGKICGGTATYGNNVLLNGSDAVFNLLGGQIMDGDVRLINGQIVVGGTVKLEEVYMAKGKQLTVSEEQPLTGEAAIGVAMEEPGVFATVANEADKAYFSSCVSGLEPKATENNGSFDLSLEKIAHKDHCVCCGNVDGHSCEDLTWKPLSQALEAVGLTMSTADFGKLPSGSYYLDGDVTVTAITPFGADNTSGNYGNKDVNIQLCLNGCDITTNTSCTFGRIYDTAVLSITDCSGEQDSDGNWSWGGTVYGGTSINGSLIYTYENSTLNIYGGNFTRKPGKTTTGCGLFVIAMDKGESTNTAANAAVMNLYNGHIYDGSSGKSGSIHVMHASTLNMYGGTVTGSKVSGDGGNICVDPSATMNLYGGTVSNGSADGKGDNIFLSGKLNAFGGTVTGGDVYVSNANRVVLGGNVQLGQLTLADGVTVKLSDETPLTGDASIGIAMANKEKAFAAVADESVKIYFFSAENGNYSILYKDQELYLTETPVSVKARSGKTMDATAQIAYTNILKAVQTGKKAAISVEALVIEDQ